MPRMRKDISFISKQADHKISTKSVQTELEVHISQQCECKLPIHHCIGKGASTTQHVEVTHSRQLPGDIFADYTIYSALSLGTMQQGCISFQFSECCHMPQYILQVLNSWKGTRTIDTTDPVIIRKYASTNNMMLKE